MHRFARYWLPVLLLALLLGASAAQGAAPAPAPDKQTGCGQVRLNKDGTPGQLQDCGQVDPNADPEGQARGVLAQRAAVLQVQADARSLKTLGVQRSDIATYVRFQQYYQDVPVYLGQALVQIAKSGNVDLVANHTLPRLNVDVTPTFAADSALQLAKTRVAAADKLRAPAKQELVIYAEGVAPTLAWHVTLNTAAPLHDWHIMVSAKDGKVLATWDQIRTPKKRDMTPKADRADDTPALPAPKLQEIDKGRLQRLPPLGVTAPMTTATPTATPNTPGGTPTPSTSGSALVYDPNPVQQTGDTSLRDNNDATSPTLDADRVQRAINHLDPPVNGVYKLKGLYVDVTSTAVTGCSLPYQPGRAQESTPVFNYTRDDDRFEEANVYASIDGVQSWFQSLGITNANARVQPVNVHCISDDNSFYSDDDKALHYGDGGVDDAEDDDVVIHEYGHAIQDNQVPGWGPGRDTEQRAMGEGFGDFLAIMAYSENGPPAYMANYKTCVMEWDATSYNPVEAGNPGSGCLRWTNGRDEATGADIGRYSGEPSEEHDDGRFWATALTCVYDKMGSNAQARDMITKLVLTSQASLVPDSSNQAFENAVDALLLADRNLYGGAHQRMIIECMAERGIIELPNAPAPVLTFPRGGEVLPPSTTTTITWDPNGAPAAAVYQVEYTAQCRPSGDFYDQVESGVNGWAANHTGNTTDWTIVATDSHSPTHSWFSASAGNVSEQFLVSPPIVVGAGSSLSFWHKYDLEAGGSSTAYDAGVVEISANGGAWTDLGAQMTLNGYNRTVSSSFDSPLGGRTAFSGDSGGWIETRATLTSYVGQTVRLRFHQATDRSIGATGWWVDDILVGTPVDQTWTLIGITPPGARSITWTTPAQQGLNYCVRVRAEAEGFIPSTWTTSGPFAVYQGTPPTPTPTRTPPPVATTPTPTATATGQPGQVTPTPTPTRTATPPPPGSTCFYISTVRIFEQMSDGSARQLSPMSEAVTVNAVGMRGSEIVFNNPTTRVGPSGETTFATLDLRTYRPRLDSGVTTYLSVNLPPSYSFLDATCQDVTGSACRVPASGGTTTTNAVQIDFACNAGVEYRFYVQRSPGAEKGDLTAPAGAPVPAYPEK